MWKYAPGNDVTIFCSSGNDYPSSFALCDPDCDEETNTLTVTDREQSGLSKDLVLIALTAVSFAFLEKLFHRPISPRTIPPRAASPPQASSSKDASARIIHNKKQVSYRAEPTSRDLQISATKSRQLTEATWRSFRALRGLARLQGVVRGHNVKCQNVNAMKQMQLLVRVETQIHSRRTRMLENQASQRQAYKNEREKESTLSKSTYNQLVRGRDK